MDMNRTLHDTNNAQRILKLTADTMLLVDKNGVCIDIDPHCDLWFLQDEILLGKNIFELLPEYTRERVVPVFQSVLEGKKSVSKNFKLVLKEDVYYFKCIMHPYDDMVLCHHPKKQRETPTGTNEPNAAGDPESGANRSVGVQYE